MLNLAISVLSIVAGFTLLIKGADIFVHRASNVAKKFGVSEFIIGLTLVAFATSIPELAGAVFSSLQGYGEIIVGNIAGSNIINLSLIFGLIALLGTVIIDQEIFKRDGYIMVLVAFIFYVFAINLIISRLEGLFLVLVYFIYLLFLMRSKELFKEYHFKEFLDYFMKFEYLTTLKEITSQRIKEKKRQKLFQFEKGLLIDLIVIALSFFAIAIGARLVISQAITLANFLQISQTVIGITVIALGTTLPELSVTITAAKKGFGNMAVGNLVGSNIANVLLIAGISALIRPLHVVRAAMFYTLPFMLFISSLTLYFIRHGRKITRLEGIILLFLYAGFMLFTFIMNY